MYAGNWGGLYKSTDSGDTWVKVGEDVPIDYVTSISIDPIAPQVVYVAAHPWLLAGTETPQLFRSDDGGGTWLTANAGLAGAVVAVEVSQRKRGLIYAATDGGGVYRTEDDGATWEPMNDGLPDLYTCALGVSPAAPEIVYAATDDGSIYSAVTGAVATAASPPSAVPPAPVPSHLLSPYPNPCNAGVAVQYVLREAGDASVVVFDLHGQRVREPIGGAQNSGPHTIHWDGRSDSGTYLASGTYEVRLQTNDRTEVRKVTVLR